MSVQLMPKVTLEPRDSDIPLSNEQILQFSLFEQLKKKPTLDKFPGAIVVRRYEKGELIFRQGDPGWTAFFILNCDDVLKILTIEIDRCTNSELLVWLKRERMYWQARKEHLAGAPPEDEQRPLATVHIAIHRDSSGNRAALTRKLLTFKNKVIEGATKNDMGNTLFIPRGGPATVSYDTLKATLEEGEIFGEMSCLYRTPRSGTVRVERDCYALELVRNIYDAIQRDKSYKAQSDVVYRRRVLNLQIRKLSIFNDLDDEQFKEMLKHIELVNYDPGQLICDEHEESNCIYLIHLGLVKVMKNVSWLVGMDDITNWAAFCEGLLQGVKSPDTPHHRLWTLLPEQTRITLRTTDDFEKMTPPDQLEVLYALNDVLAAEELTDAEEMKSISETDSFQEQITDFPRKRKDWHSKHIRKHNRLLLEALIPKGLRKHKRYAALESILSYRSQGEFFGEMGIMLNRPRAATCIAYGHPNDYGQVELVRISQEGFNKMLKMSSKIRDRFKKEVSERRRETILRLASPVWDEENQVQFSDKFENLGLIQGQRLMLIDLDRCTRCDECVNACVRTHNDGNTRLFLDGPRFGNYLVPTSCRSCLDPVCLIGCPVGSIHRGANREIIIEDWCIGCSACADGCPYGSIQMHDLGIVPETARGWKFLSANEVGEDNWMEKRYKAKQWLTGTAPFKWNRDAQEMVKSVPLGKVRFRFRYEFSMSRAHVKDSSRRYRIELTAVGGEVHLWLNGKELQFEGKPRRGRHEYSIPPKPDEKKDNQQNASPEKGLLASDFLDAGMNVIAVEVAPPKTANDVLFQLRLDEVKRPKGLPEDIDKDVVEEVTEKLVTSRAVVCDLCSTSRSRIPACVHACPHDAAMRVDARSEFPMQ